MHLRDSLIPDMPSLFTMDSGLLPKGSFSHRLIKVRKKSPDVRLKLYKGSITTVGRKSPYSLYDDKVASMEGDISDYQPEDAGGFIRPNGLRLKERSRKTRIQLILTASHEKAPRNR